MVKQNQKGAVIIFVVAIIGIIGILYATLYVLIGTERKIHQSLTNRTKAYYVAESGLERGIALLKQGNSSSFVCDNPFSAQYKHEHRFNVTIVQAQPDIYTITSTGTYDNAVRRLEAVVLRNDETFSIQSWKEIN